VFELLWSHIFLSQHQAFLKLLFSFLIVVPLIDGN